MKILSVIFALIVILCSAVWYYDRQPENEHMQTWLKHTKGLLQGAEDLFSSFKRPQDDEKLKELLPPDELDLSYQPSDLNTQVEEGSVPLVSQNDARELLPDMFNPVNQPKTSVKGQVHTDENDNIIGAEVQVAIPAGM